MWEEQPSLPVVCITTFGPFLMEWLNSGQRYTPVSMTERDMKGVLPARSLLKLLLCQPHRYAPRDWVLEQFWPEMEHKAALHRVGNVVWILRRLLCPPQAQDPDKLRSLLLTSTQSDQSTGLGYQLAAYPLIWVDADAFEWYVEQASRASRFGDDPLPFWQRAYALGERGTFLSDEIYGEWTIQRRNRLDGHFRQCLFELSRLLIARGLTTEAEVYLRKYVVSHPTDEDVLRLLMELLGQQERYQELLSLYQTCETALADEDRQPDSRTQDIAEYFKSKQIRRPAAPPTEALLSAKPYARHLLPAQSLTDFFDAHILERFSQAILKPLHLDETTFQYLETCIEQLWKNRHSAVLSSRDLFGPVSLHFQKILALLEGSLLPNERRRLCYLLSQTTQLLGELCIDMGHYAQGKTFHQAALTAAQEALDPFLEAVSWGRISLACVYSEALADASTSIEQARLLAQKCAPPMIQGWLAAIEAEIQAHLLQSDACLQALKQAECFDRQLSSPKASYLVHFDLSLLGGYQGVCFRLLSRPEGEQSAYFLQKSQDALQSAITSLDPFFIQRKPTFLADLARVTIDQQDIEQACALISQAATLATQWHLHKVIQRLVALREPLSPWSELACVKTLDAHLAFLSSRESQSH